MEERPWHNIKITKEGIEIVNEAYIEVLGFIPNIQQIELLKKSLVKNVDKHIEKRLKR